MPSQGQPRGAGQAAGDRFVQFSRGAAQRIAKVVRIVEGGDRAQNGVVFDHPMPSGGGKIFRVCTFTGSWSINATKTVTFKYQSTTPNTAVVTNLFCGLSPAGTCDVSIAKDGTSWFLLQPNLTQLPGYSGSGTAVLVAQDGFLSFVGTTACTATA